MTDPRRLAIVAYARSQIGPGNIPEYWRSCGISPAPDPKSKYGQWCGIFALACLHAAHVAEKLMWKTGIGFISPARLVRTTEPQPGDIMYIDYPYRHHGIVESLVNGVLTTIEGNTPTVKRKVRPLPKEGVVFYSIASLLGEALPKSVPVARPTVPVAEKSSGGETPLIRGLDVSHYQAPARINWVAAGKSYKFVFVRATYGTQKDVACVEHVQRARAVGMVVGLYAFFRPQQEISAQLDAFDEIVEAANFGVGDLPPALDIENNEKFGDGAFTGQRYERADTIADTWRERWGSAFLYMGTAAWKELGEPDWVRDNYLWVPNWTGVKEPPTPPGMPWVIWQNRVSVLPGIYQSEIDQNIAKALPLIQKPTIPLLGLDPDWEAMRRDRDALVSEID